MIQGYAANTSRFTNSPLTVTTFTLRDPGLGRCERTNQHQHGYPKKHAAGDIVVENEEPQPRANEAASSDYRTDPLTALHQLRRGCNLPIITVMAPVRLSLGHRNDSLDRPRPSLLVPCQHFRWRDGELILLCVGIPYRPAEVSVWLVASLSRSPTFVHALPCVRRGVFAAIENSVVGWMLIEAIPI